MCVCEHPLTQNDCHTMNEAETRADHIDPALKAAGWGVVEGSRIRREYEITMGRLEGFGRRAKKLKCDYVLEYKNKKLGIVEAKAWGEAHTEGVAQAKNYAEKMTIRFTYSTNGQLIYGIDMDTGVEGDVSRYPTPDELWNMTFAQQNTWRDRFAAVPFEDKGGSYQSRYYQDIAVERVTEAIAAGKQRILLTLATGTGKTFIAFQIAWKLFQSRWTLSREADRRPRILFLADRNVLANQAFNSFRRTAICSLRSFRHLCPGRRKTENRHRTSASTRPISSTSSSSTNAIGAGRTMKAHGAESSTISRPPCNSV